MDTPVGCVVIPIPECTIGSRASLRCIEALSIFRDAYAVEFLGLPEVHAETDPASRPAG
jgi:hypothetical protein